LAAAYTSTFVLTITNPMTIIAFLAIFAGLGIATTARDYAAASMLVLGVFTGSALWWLLLSGGMGLLRTRLDLRHLWWINRLSGAIIVGFGVLALLGLRG
ncbi:MAG TPA: LysE family transporter, partial [Herpetosiphonaceae bacterium]